MTVPAHLRELKERKDAERKERQQEKRKLEQQKVQESATSVAITKTQERERDAKRKKHSSSCLHGFPDPSEFFMNCLDQPAAPGAQLRKLREAMSAQDPTSKAA